MANKIILALVFLRSGEKENYIYRELASTRKFGIERYKIVNIIYKEAYGVAYVDER